MSFLGKPSWIGSPVLVKQNIWKVIVALLVMLFISATVAAILSATAFQNNSDPLGTFGFLSVAFFAILIFAAGWFIIVLFWFRCIVNILKMSRNPSEAARGKWYRAFWVPMFGWRNKDLSQKGIYYRRLVLDGFFGGIFVGLVVFAVASLSGLVGMEW